MTYDQLLEDNNRKAQIIKLLEQQVADAHVFALKQVADTLATLGPESSQPETYASIATAIRHQCTTLKDTPCNT